MGLYYITELNNIVLLTNDASYIIIIVIIFEYIVQSIFQTHFYCTYHYIFKNWVIVLYIVLVVY